MCTYERYRSQAAIDSQPKEGRGSMQVTPGLSGRVNPIYIYIYIYTHIYTYMYMRRSSQPKCPGGMQVTPGELEHPHTYIYIYIHT